MTNRINKNAFNRLKKLTPKKRAQLADSRVGQSYLALLTPTQFAELFPKYYERNYPNIEGFRKAVSKMSAEKQQKYFENVDKRLDTLGSTEGGNYSGPVKGWWTPERQKYAVEYLMKNGKFTAYGAAAAVARMTKEAPGGPGDSNNIGGGHWGIAQWGISRGGRSMAGASFDDQLAHYVKESWTSEKAAGDRFRSAQNAREGSEAAMHFERAEGYKESGGRYDVLVNNTPVDTVYGNAFGGKAPAGGEGYVDSASGGNFVGQAFPGLRGLNQCVQYARAAGGLSHTSNWSPGQKAMDGGLKPGDWLARFNPDGKYGNQYGYSHVARFEGYKRDEKGNILGMYVTHQYGRKAVHSDFIPAGNARSSEFDANNYHQIHDRGVPATMHQKDEGRKEKVSARDDYFRNNPNAIEPEHKKERVTVAAAVPHAVPPMPYQANKPSETAAVLSAAEFFRQRYSPDKKREDVKVTSTKGMQHYAMADTGTMTDATPAKTKPVPVEQAKRHLFDAMNNHDIHDPNLRAALAAHAKGESNFKIPQSELSYSKTSAKRLKGIFKSTLGKMSNAQVDILKKDDKAFYNVIYGKKNGNKGGDDGWNYRGRGYVQLTGRGNYQKYGDQIGVDLINNPELANDPKIAADIAAVYVKDRIPKRGTAFDKVTKAIGIPVKGVHEKKRQAFMDYIKSGEFHSSSTMIPPLPMDANIDVATVQQGPGPGPLPAVAQTSTPEPMPTPSSPAQKVAQVPEPVKKSPMDMIFPKAAAEHTPSQPAPIPTQDRTHTTPRAEGPAAEPTSPPTAEVKPPAPVAPVKAPEESSTKSFLKSQGVGVPGAATGGAFTIPEGGFKMEPIAVSKGDNMAAVSNKTGTPLFTARSDEAMTYDPSQRRVDVIPSRKVDGRGMGPSVNPMKGQLDTLREEMQAAMASAGQAQKVQMRQGQSQRSDTPNFIDNLTKEIQRKPFNNPAFERAMNRTRMHEHGDSLNNHFGSGNINY